MKYKRKIIAATNVNYKTFYASWNGIFVNV